jgi:hypothetical protein
VSDPAEVLEQRPVELEIGPEHLGQGENPVAVRDRGEHVAGEELPEEEHPLGAGGRVPGAPRGRGDYQTFPGKLSPYELHSLHLLAYHGNWYVLALNSAKGRVGTFSLSRFRKVEVTGRTFQRPEDFDARSHARQAFGITAGEKPMRVRLLFEPKLAVYISERQWHASQVRKKRRDGRVELRLETTGRKELVRWVLSWMLDVRVLAPKSLRERIALKLEEGLRRNTESEGEPNNKGCIAA